MALFNSAFRGLGSMRTALPLPRSMDRVVPAQVRAFHSTPVACKLNPHLDSQRRLSAHSNSTPEEDLAPLQKMFTQSSQRAKPMRVTLEKPKFGVEKRGPEPLTEEQFEEAFRLRPLRGYTINFTPYSGRTVPVRHGNVQSSIRELNKILFENNVRRQFRNQQYFERPTKARRRIRQERHYRKFAAAVREKVQLVQRERLRKKTFKAKGLANFFPDA